MHNSGFFYWFLLLIVLVTSSCATSIVEKQELRVSGTDSEISFNEFNDSIVVTLLIPDEEYALENREDLIRQMIVVKLDSILHDLNKRLIIVNQDCSSLKCGDKFVYPIQQINIILSLKKELTPLRRKLIRISVYEGAVVSGIINAYNILNNTGLDYDVYRLFIELSGKCYLEGGLPKNFQKYFHDLIIFNNKYYHDAKLSRNHILELCGMLCDYSDITTYKG